MAPAKTVRQMKDLLLIRREDGSVVGFHGRNLEVASLSFDTWIASQEPQTLGSSALALEELRQWEESNSSVVKKEKRETGVRALTVNVTQVCNLHCKYCAAGGDGSYGDPIKRIVLETAIPSVVSLMSQVPTGEEFRLTFLGGEPLLYPAGVELLAEETLRIANERGIKIGFHIVTNGTQFTEQNIEILKRFKMEITVSIDGPADVNDVRRPTKGGRGATAKIEEGLHKLLQSKKDLGTVLLSGVFGKDNLDLIKAYFFYRQFDADWFDFTYDHHETSEEINQRFIIEMNRVAELAFSLGGEKELRRIHTFDRYFKSLDHQQQIENYCSAGKNFLMMDARENLYTCPWLVGDTKEVVGYGGKVWGERLKDYQEPLIDKHGCGSCWARYLCGGGCMYINRQVTGDRHRVDKNYCERTRNLIATTLVYYERMRGL